MKGNPHALGIDHLLFVVDDLDRAASAFRRLGFTVGPRGVHSAHLGNANHTVVLREDYLELIGVLQPTPMNQVHRDNLKLGEGCHTVAITTDSAAGTKRAVAESGIAMDEPVSFSRPVELPDGSQAEAEFEVVRPRRAELPAGFMFFCHHKTPDVVWIREWMSHPNTAERISAVVVATDAPAASAEVYRKLFRARDLETVEGGVRVATGKADLEFLKPERIADLYRAAGPEHIASPHFKVARIEVGDLGAAEKVLTDNGVVLASAGPEALLVAPADGCGTAIEFIGGAPPARGRISGT